VRIIPILAAAGTVLVLAACSGDDGDPAADATSAAPTVTASGPEGTEPAGTVSPTGPTTSPSPGPPATAAPGASVAVSPLPPAPVGDDAALSTGVAITVTGVRDVQVKATGPGEIAGNGVQVTVRVRNTASTVFNLSGLAVVASYGSGTPADPSGSAETKSLSGALRSGQTAEGTYYFLVPKAQAGSLRVEVSSSSSPNIAVFER
jgi:hypothetical protein